MNFEIVKKALAENFANITKDHILYEADVDADKLWNLYLSSFPDKTN